MNEQDIDKYFKGYKWHHLLIYFPAGALCMEGLSRGDPEEWIGAILILVGGVLQARFFWNAIRKMIHFLRENVNELP